MCDGFLATNLLPADSLTDNCLTPYDLELSFTDYYLLLIPSGLIENSALAAGIELVDYFLLLKPLFDISF